MTLLVEACCCCCATGGGCACCCAVGGGCCNTTVVPPPPPPPPACTAICWVSMATVDAMPPGTVMQRPGRAPRSRQESRELRPAAGSWLGGGSDNGQRAQEVGGCDTSQKCAQRALLLAKSCHSVPLVAPPAASLMLLSRRIWAFPHSDSQASRPAASVEKPDHWFRVGSPPGP